VAQRFLVRYFGKLSRSKGILDGLWVTRAARAQWIMNEQIDGNWAPNIHTIHCHICWPSLTTNGYLNSA
jgi:hypothetical protein